MLDPEGGDTTSKTWIFHF